jgi:hypothetical protein
MINNIPYSMNLEQRYIVFLGASGKNKNRCGTITAKNLLLIADLDDTPPSQLSEWRRNGKKLHLGDIALVEFPSGFFTISRSGLDGLYQYISDLYSE